MTLTLYLDFLSQPSRALYIFFKLNNIPFNLHEVDLRSGEHFSEEFKEKLNRFGKVPFIHDSSFKLAESIAIVRYVARKHNINNNWYPSDSEQQARVDEYLEWQHNNTRAFCALYFQKRWVLPLLTGKDPTPENLQKFQDNMVNCLDTIETVWLAKTNFLAGDKISVADIFAACEIEQVRVAGFDPREGRPTLTAWLQRVRNQTNPFYDEAHKVVNKLAQKTKEKQMKSKL